MFLLDNESGFKTIDEKIEHFLIYQGFEAND
jgi:hypothetical protein